MREYLLIHHQCAASTWMMRRQPYCAHSLLVERRRSDEVNRCMWRLGGHDGQRPMGEFGEDAGVTPLLLNISRFNIVRESAFWIGVGRSFNQPGTVNENVLESDFVSLCDGTTRHRSLVDLRLLEECRFIKVSGSKRVLSLWLLYMSNSVS